MKKLWALLFACLLCTACGKKVVQAPVPGSIDSFDAYAFRSIADAQAALLSVKGWETCSDQKFPLTVTYDNHTETCDKNSGDFPSAGRQPLMKAEQSYNLVQAAGKAYHAGASSDSAALTAALTELSGDIALMLTSVGRTK